MNVGRYLRGEDLHVGTARVTKGSKMKTIEQILVLYKSETIDGRDLGRLARFLTESQIESLGMSLNEEFKGKHVPEPYTREAVIEALRGDIEFGFEKALNRRGISASLMFSVVQMWNWILEEGLENYDEDNGYAQYGLPLFKATALKYGFDNPIGDDVGDEDKYSSEAYYG